MLELKIPSEAFLGDGEGKLRCGYGSWDESQFGLASQGTGGSMDCPPKQ